MALETDSAPASASGEPERPLPALPRGLRLDGTESPVLRLTRVGLRLLVRAAVRGRLRPQGLELVPPSGPLLICSNHLSNFDPLVYGAIVPRVLHALTKSELFDSRPLGAYLARCNCIPVRRGEPDRLAIRGALAVLRSGGALVLFPEGHRSPPGRPRPFEAGAGYLALRSGAQVLPCAIWGSEGVLGKGQLLPRRARVGLRVGSPFRPSARGPAAASVEIRSRVLALLPEAYRGSADADHLDREDEG